MTVRRGKRPTLSFAKLESPMQMPDLLGVQRDSFEKLVGKGVESAEDHWDFGLDRVFREHFPVEDVNGALTLEYVKVELDDPAYTVDECIERDMTYSAPVRATLRLIVWDVPATRSKRRVPAKKDRRVKSFIDKDVYLGELPLLTEMGTFVINGSERVIVNQLHRSPGVVFEEKIHANRTRLHSARIIPFRGSWLEFTTDINDVCHVHIDKKRKFPATALLRARGFGSKADVLGLFYARRRRGLAVWEMFPPEEGSSSQPAEEYDPPENALLVEDVVDVETGEVLEKAGQVLDKERVASLRARGIREVLRTRDLTGWLLAEDVMPDPPGGLLADDAPSVAPLAIAGDELNVELVRRFLRHGRTEVEVFAPYDVVRKSDAADDIWHRRLENLRGETVAVDVVDQETGEILVEKDSEVDDAVIETVLGNELVSIAIYSSGRSYSKLILNTLDKDPTESEEKALFEIYKLLRPGEAPNVKTARDALNRSLFSKLRYDLGRVGRYKANLRLGTDAPPDQGVLSIEDLVAIIRRLVDYNEGRGAPDDIDHLGNRRVRTIGELIANQFSIGLSRMVRLVRERMSSNNDPDKINLDTLVNARTVDAVVKTFFGSSQLSQFMDQTNPLAEVTHKRRLSALGPGGLTRERAGFEVRDVHYSHYGRMCPVETPEGPNIGLIASLATHARVNDMGFVETPYRRVVDGRVTDEIHWLSAYEEESEVVDADGNRRFVAIAQANAPLNEDGRFEKPRALCRQKADYRMLEPGEIDYMDVAPAQLVSAAAALIPFLEHDDANRALMGSNMQRQAVPLLHTEAPLVGTGLESRVARDSGSVIKAKRKGTVVDVNADEILVDTGYRRRAKKDAPLVRLQRFDRYHLKKFWRTNQDTAINQRPLVSRGDNVEAGQIIADGASTDAGELALGRNLVAAFMPWYGYNFEDAIVISERLVKDDVFTSIHIQELELQVRDTKRGMEEITVELPNVADEAITDLDERGIVRVGARVEHGDILCGKITPKGETELSPEEKLLTAIFGEKAKDVKDSSLRVPPGMTGTVIDVKVFSRHPDDPLLEREYGQRIGRLRETEREEVARVTRERDDELRAILKGETIKLMLRRGVVEPVFEEGTVLGVKDLKKLDFQDIDLGALKVAKKTANDRVRALVSESHKRIARIKQDTEEEIDKVFEPDELSPGVAQLIKIFVAEKRKISVGDKMAGRHGNKGIIARIAPEEDMPFLPDGTPVDIVLNPLGVPSRMNLGQVLEAHLGWACQVLGFEAKTPVFQGASENEIGLLMKMAGLKWLCDSHDLDAGRLPVEIEDLRVLREMAKRLPPKLSNAEANGDRGRVAPRGIGQPFDAYARDLARWRRSAAEDSEADAESAERENESDLIAGIRKFCTEVAREIAERGGTTVERLFPKVALLDESPSQEASVDEAVIELIAYADLFPQGKIWLRDGRSGARFDFPVTVGSVYMLKLSHLVDDKIHARSIGPYSLVTQQPLAGKAQFGGQRFGEMEVWALEAYGASHTLREILTVKSDDVMGRSKVYEAIVKGDNLPRPGVPESFNVLVKELNALGLKVDFGNEEVQ